MRAKWRERVRNDRRLGERNAAADGETDGDREGRDRPGKRE